ncbi:MAG TPA: hypothetical protein VH933_05650 [Aestuariivirgaceae bacterium]|jgi:hypothetical protein
MDFRRILLATLAAATIAAAGSTATTARAEVNVYLNIPGFGMMPGYVYEGRRYISCRHGARIVDRRGFNRVQPWDCSRPYYRYRARRDGIWWLVRLNALNGIIVSARPL